MSKKKDEEIPFWAKLGHKKPVSRREFLAAGLIPFSAALLMPRWMNLLMPSVAEAQTGTCVPSSSAIAFIHLNLSGGAALAGNTVVTDTGGNLLSNYDLLGLGTGNGFSQTTEFGGVPFPSGGQILAGIRQMGASALAKTSFVSIPVHSQDDTGNNTFSIAGLLNKANVAGSLVPNLGTNGSVTGVNQQPAYLPPSAPLTVQSLNSLTGALSYAGAIGKSLSPAQQQNLATVISNLSQTQARNLASLQNQSTIQNLLYCVGIKNTQVLNHGSSFDPRNDSSVGGQLSTLWGLTAGNGGNSGQNMVFAASVYNVLAGNAGAAALEMGGFDYHDGTRTTGDAKDLQAGQTIGRILQSASLMGKKVFIYVTSDGGITSQKGSGNGAVWTSDRGNSGMAYMIYHDPAGRHPTTGNQVGGFTAGSGQAADETTQTGASAQMTAGAVFANYLQLNGRLGDLANIVTTPLSISGPASVIRFA